MAGQRRIRGVRTVTALLLALLVGCGGAHPPADTAQDTAQRLLDRRAAAVLAHDADAYAATGERAGYARLRSLPLASWSYRVTSARRDGDSLTAEAELSYRVDGYDRAPVTAARTLRLARTAAGTWAVASERPAPKAGAQLWDQGAVTVARGAHSLVLGVGRTGGQLRAFADLADRAVPAVSAAWGEDWARHVVVLVPGSLDGMAALLGSPAASYRGIAAVTTGETGGAPRAPADRIIVNPDAYGVLGPVGRQVVLTHETAHVATRAHTGPSTPLWLSEGYADWVGYRGTGRTPSQVAPELQRAVTDGRTPTALPADEDFAFTGDATRLARAYESGWLACRLIAAHWGEARLDALYRAVGAHPRRSDALEHAMKSTLSTTPEAFTATWRSYAEEQLG
ncbi:hypothetical protein [Streptomyces sp. NPDC002132]|uniref:hypothetical protein n=1 Tax=unclassified Streptomyces TaxID=2593676 RepID=UPI003320A9C7